MGLSSKVDVVQDDAIPASESLKGYITSIVRNLLAMDLMCPHRLLQNDS
jgi:hypothetical protein